MVCLKMNPANYWTVSWPFSNRHRLASLWLITSALFVLSSSHPIADGVSKSNNTNLIVAGSYFDQLVKDIHGLVVAVYNDASVKMFAEARAGESKEITTRGKSLFEDFPFESSKSCSVTVDELEQMNELLQSIGNNDVNHNLSCDIKEVEPAIVSLTDSPHQCLHIIESIITNVNDVKNAFWCLSQATSTSNHHRYEEMKAAYETKVIQLQLQLDNAEKQFEQKFKKKIDNLTKHYHELEKKMREIVDELQRERFAHSQESIELIVEYLVNGKIEPAWEKFRSKSMGKSEIIAIIERATSKDFSANVPIRNVIRFIGGLKDNVAAIVYGIIRLFDKLEERQTLDRDTVNVLHTTINDVIKTCIDLEEGELWESRLTLDEDIIYQLILVLNKIDYLAWYVQ